MALSGPHAPYALPDVLLWEKGAMRCVCRYRPTDEIEVILTVNSTVIERKLFTHANQAADYVLAKMHAYNVPY